MSLVEVKSERIYLLLAACYLVYLVFGIWYLVFGTCCLVRGGRSEEEASSNGALEDS